MGRGDRPYSDAPARLLPLKDNAEPAGATLEYQIINSGGLRRGYDLREQMI